jgi:hypothetical protein
MPIVFLPPLKSSISTQPFIPTVCFQVNFACTRPIVARDDVMAISVHNTSNPARITKGKIYQEDFSVCMDKKYHYFSYYCVFHFLIPLLLHHSYLIKGYKLSSSRYNSFIWDLMFFSIIQISNEYIGVKHNRIIHNDILISLPPLPRFKFSF